jgi:hypothetical protein
MPYFGTNVNQKCVNMSKTKLRFYITKKDQIFFFEIVSRNCPKRLNNRLFLPESPLFEAKIYRNLER